MVYPQAAVRVHSTILQVPNEYTQEHPNAPADGRARAGGEGATQSMKVSLGAQLSAAAGLQAKTVRVPDPSCPMPTASSPWQPEPGCLWMLSGALISPASAWWQQFTIQMSRLEPDSEMRA